MTIQEDLPQDMIYINDQLTEDFIKKVKYYFSLLNEKKNIINIPNTITPGKIAKIISSKEKNIDIKMIELCVCLAVMNTLSDENLDEKEKMILNM